MAYKIDIAGKLSVQLSDKSIAPTSCYNTYLYYKDNNDDGQSYEQFSDYINVQPGYNAIIAVGNNDYFGYLTSYVLAYVDPMHAKISLRYKDEFYQNEKLSATYTGDYIEPFPLLKVNSEPISPKIESWTFKYFDSNADQLIHHKFNDYNTYYYSYANNKDVSTSAASVIIDPGDSVVSQRQVFTFYVMPYVFSNINIFNFVDVLPYEPPTTIQSSMYVAFDGKMCIRDRDYMLNYEENEDLGNATLTIKGINNFSGTLVKQYRISGDLGASDTQIYVDDQYSIHPESITHQYNGNVYEPAIYVMLKDTLKLSPNDNEYNVIYGIESDYDCINPGKKICKIEGINNCFGTQNSFYYSISTDINNCTLVGFNNIIEYTGYVIRPQPNIVFYGVGRTIDLVPGVDFDYLYTSSGNYVDENIYSMSIIGKTYWLGKIDLSFVIYSDFSTMIIYVDDSVKILNRTETANLTRAAIGLGPEDYSIKKIIVGNATQQIENYLLANCYNLVEADFSKVTQAEIPYGCFENCRSLTTIKFPS